MNRTSLPDRVTPGIRVLFVGINPGLRSAALGHHFAGHSNRFWKLLHESGLVPVRLGFADDGRLPEFGYGITNLVARATAGIDDLRPEEYRQGRARLVAKVRRLEPRVVALVGVTIYRSLFDQPAARPLTVGLQPRTLGRVPVFVLPNPSGRNANFSYAEMLDAFRGLKRYVEEGARRD